MLNARIWLQRSILLIVLIVGSGLYALRTARAAVSSQVLELSKRLLDLPAEWQTGEPRELLLNGARMGILTGHSELPLPLLLDRLQASCRARSAGLGDLLRNAQRASAELPSLVDGVLRFESAQAGVVACLELGSAPLTLPALVARFTALAETGDLAELGAVRMVRVEAREQGSFFVLAASDGPLPLGQMFPEHGDAPGFDPTLAPRPSHARRTLSVLQLGQEPSLVLYESTRALAPTWQAYRAQLRKSGHALINEGDAGEDAYAGLYGRSGHYLLVVASRDGETSTLALSALDHVPASILRSRARGHASTRVSEGALQPEKSARATQPR